MLIFDPTDTNNWSEVGTIERDFLVDPREVVLPVQLSSRILAVSALALNIPTTWVYAGLAYQKIQAPFNIAGLSSLPTTAQKVFLNTPAILTYPECNYNYYLGFLVPNWLPNLQLQVWEFIGDIEDTSVINTSLRIGRATSKTLTIGTATQQILNPDPNRRGIKLYNASNAAIYVGYSNAITISNHAFRIVSNGYWEEPRAYTGALWAVAQNAGKTLYVTEEFET